MIPHLVDATVFFSRTGGGVRRYLLAQHDWLCRQPRVRHSLVVPGAADRGAAGEIVEFGSPLLRAGYRCPLWLAAFRRTLATLRPDLIEAADPYLVGWQVARVADELGVPAVAFCHSDVIGLARHRLGDHGGRLAGHYLRALRPLRADTRAEPRGRGAAARRRHR